MLRLRRCLVALTIPLLLAAACSDSDDGSTDTTTTSEVVVTTEADTAPSTTAAADQSALDLTAVLATVGDIEITAADLNEETSLAREFGEANPEQAAALADPDNPEIRADLLTGLIINDLMQSLLTDDAGVTEAQRTSVADSLPPGIVSTEWLDRFIDRQAVYLAYGQFAAIDAGLEATPDEWFAANPDALGDIACSRHILVETEETALEVRTRIVDGGEDFATVAQEASTGPSGPNGGDLGCDDPSGFVPEFADVVRTLPINEISEPVETQFGFHVIEVTGRGADALDENELASRIAELYDVEVGTVAEEALTTLLTETPITVDPSIGTWDPEIRTITPPAG